MNFPMVIMAPLFGGNVVSFDKEKCLPDRLHASGSLSQTALLCMASVIWLREYARNTSSCVETYSRIWSVLFLVVAVGLYCCDATELSGLRIVMSTACAR